MLTIITSLILLILGVMLFAMAGHTREVQEILMEYDETNVASNPEVFGSKNGVDTFSDSTKDNYASVRSEAKQKTTSDQVTLEVPHFLQYPELPTGCEATAVAMMLSVEGTSVSKMDIVQEMPYDSSNPYLGYVGDPASVNGWTIYPSALLTVVESHTGSSVDLTGTSLEVLKEHLDANKAVCCWFAWSDGDPYQIRFVHCVTLVGYDEQNIYYNDPLGEAYTAVSYQEFLSLWENCHSMALSY